VPNSSHQCCPSSRCVICAVGGWKLDDGTSCAWPRWTGHTITLKSDGSKITGTIYGSQPIPLEGTIEGDTLRVTLKLTTVNGRERRENYIATLTGDELKFTHQSENGRLPVFGPAAKEFTAPGSGEDGCVAAKGVARSCGGADSTGRVRLRASLSGTVAQTSVDAISADAHSPRHRPRTHIGVAQCPRWTIRCRTSNASLQRHHALARRLRSDPRAHPASVKSSP
jgi:hypothetical protein